jgi:hypothetical protein
VPDRLEHVYWIGGGSGAGKSAVAARLSARYALRPYSTDEAMADHASRSPQAAYLRMFAAMDMDERWVKRSPAQMLETFHWYRGEGFEPLVEDLAALAPQPVVAEGFRLLPDLVAPLAAPGHAVWLLPTPQFRRTVFAARGWPRTGFVARTDAPERALENLLARDALFTDRLRSSVSRLALPVIEVDGSLTADELAQRVASLFGLDSAP